MPSGSRRLRNPAPACPTCSQDDQVEKVSTLYLVGIGLKPHPESDENGQPDFEFRLTSLTEAELRELARRLKPPASTRRMPARPLHPDLVVITFSLIIPIFLYGMLTSQRAILPPVLAFLAVTYGLYFWKRKAIVARFESRQAAQRLADERVKGAIERWMKLYYCLRDDGVFESGQAELTPVDQIAWRLQREN